MNHPLLDNFLMRDLWFLQNPSWALKIWRTLLPKQRTGILWVINTWPYERPLGRGSPGMLHPKILPSFFPPRPTEIALGLHDPMAVGVSLCFVSFSMASMNVVVLETIYISSLCPACPFAWLYGPNFGADDRSELFPLPLAPSHSLALKCGTHFP